MADITIDNEVIPGTPASGYSTVFVDSTSKELSTIDDAGKTVTLRPLTNANTSNDTSASGNADAYLASSKLTVPLQDVRAGTTFRWRFVMTKTGAGAATPIWKVWAGTLGTTGDTTLLTFTMGAQTGVIDTGWCDITVVVQTAGASGVVEGAIRFAHGALAVTAATGLGSAFEQFAQAASTPAFNLTTNSLIFGVSVNPGLSGVWTFQIITAQLLNV